MPTAPTTVGSTPYRPPTARRTGAGWPARPNQCATTPPLPQEGGDAAQSGSRDLPPGPVLLSRESGASTAFARRAIDRAAFTGERHSDASATLLVLARGLHE